MLTDARYSEDMRERAFSLPPVFIRRACHFLFRTCRMEVRRLAKGPVPLLVLLPGLLLADDQVQKLIERLSEEAATFQRIAPQMIGQETLVQRASKPPARFRPRIGEAARKPPEPRWQQRELQSEYAFAAFAGESGSLHEIRQITAIDGKKIQDSKRAQESLAKAITAEGDERKKQLLKDFEKNGLSGAVTDFGQIILLFAPRDILHYDFAYRRTEQRGAARLLVFEYKQVDGPDEFTLIDKRRGDVATRVPIAGEVWVWESNLRPARVTMSVNQGVGDQAVRNQATVDYEMSDYGVLLPTSTEHREIRQGAVVAENRFKYADFKKFGASSDLKFEVDPSQ
jgi:hypothetical protein